MAAGLFATGVASVLQWLLVPFLVVHWGALLYGEWVWYSSLAQFIFVADCGFAAAAANRMRWLYGAKERQALREVFTAASLVSLLFSSLFCFVLWFLFRQPVLAVFCFIFWLMQRSGALHDVFRAAGELPRATWWNGGLVCFETLVLALAVGGGQSLVVSLGWMAVARGLGLAAMALDLLYRHRWFRPRLRDFRTQRVGELIRPALASWGLNLSETLNVQAMANCVGAVSGPEALAVFSTTRTLANASAPLAGLLRNTVVMELSGLLGAKRQRAAIALQKKLSRLTVPLMAFGTMVLYCVGPTLYSVWTRKALVLDSTLFGLLLLASFLSVWWQASSATAVARNRFGWIVIARIAAVTVGLVLAVLWEPAWGLVAFGVSLVVVEGAMLGGLFFLRLNRPDEVG